MPGVQLQQVRERHDTSLRVDAGPLPGGGIALVQQLGGAVSGLLEERDGGLGVAPQVVQAALPHILVVDGQDRLVLRDDKSKAHRAHQLGIGEVDDDVADRPVLAGRPPVDRPRIKPVDGLPQERRADGEAVECRTEWLRDVGHTPV